MGQPDGKNAHVRKGTRQSADNQAAEAERLLNDPAFNRGFDTLRDGLIREIEDLKHDGQDATIAYELELCRTLRTLKSLKRSIGLGIQGQKLRLAGFRPEEVPTTEGD